MSTWPDYAVIEADGYRLTRDPDVARTPFDDGMVRQEKRFTAALDTRRITALLADDNALTRFRTWAEDHAHEWFAWTDTEDGVAREVRVRGGAGGIEYRARVDAGARRWEASLVLEGFRGRVIETEGA